MISPARHWLMRIKKISAYSLAASRLDITGDCQPHDAGTGPPPWAGENFYLVPEAEYEELIRK